MAAVLPWLAGISGGWAATATVGAGAGLFSAAGALVGRLLTSVALSALSAAIAPKPKAGEVAGLVTDYTTTGETQAASFILGRYATEGHLVCPPMSHGDAGGVPNAFLTYVVDLGDVPGQALSGLIIDGAKVEIGSAPLSDYGQPIQGDLLGYAWVKYHDGSQTVADPMLLAKYAEYPERPWTAEMVGRGTCYAIVTFQYNREIFQGFPSVRFEMVGIPLYDPRKDSTVGGVGLHRVDDPTTWEPSENFAVQAYNIGLGIEVRGEVWGGGVSEMPLADWMAQMDVCDIDHGDGPQYRTGIEVKVTDAPVSILEELAKGASAEFCELAGRLRVRCGPPELPVFFFTDDDLDRAASETFTVVPDEPIYRGVRATFINPDDLWESREAPALEEAAALDEDIAELSLSAVIYTPQVQRLQASYLADNKRRRAHVITLPPDAEALEPLDAVAWSSAGNGYASKVFEVRAVTCDPKTGWVKAAIREKDFADYDPVAVVDLPPRAVAPVAADPVVLSGFAVEGVAIGVGEHQRPGLRLSVASGLAGLSVAWEVRPVGGALVAAGSDVLPQGAELYVQAGIVPGVAFEARAKALVNRPAPWTAWVSATAPDIRLTSADLSDAVNQSIADAAQSAAADLAAAQAAAASAADRARAILSEGISALALSSQAALGASAGNWDFRDGWTGWVTSEDASADPLGLADIRVGEITGDEADTTFEVADQSAIAAAIMASALAINGE